MLRFRLNVAIVDQIFEVAVSNQIGQEFLIIGNKGHDGGMQLLQIALRHRALLAPSLAPSYFLTVGNVGTLWNGLVFPGS